MSEHLYTVTYIWKPEQQQFTMRNGVLTSISGRQRSAIKGRLQAELAKKNDLFSYTRREMNTTREHVTQIC